MDTAIDVDTAITTVSSIHGRGDAWAYRSDFWQHEYDTPVTGKLRHRQLRRPLILTGHGVRLRVDHGTLLVQDGFTHYPQQRQEHRFFPGDWRTPSRIVLLDCDGGVSFDALAWLSGQQIPLIQINWRGDVLTVAGGSGHALDMKLVDTQLAAQRNGKGLEVARALVARKIQNSIETLRECFPSSPLLTTALRNLEQRASEIERLRPKKNSEVHGIEGHAAGIYFMAWTGYPIRWKGVGRHAIPEDWKYVGSRQSALSNLKYRNRYATHPVNAMLNNAYGVLHAHVRQHVIAAGLDPLIGYLHGNYRDKAALVYDLMEPLRPIADRGVLEFVQQHVFEPADFTLSREGMCRLNPQLARALVKEVGAKIDVEAVVSGLAKKL